jgi:holliday junction DNA helicase RuvA
MIGKLKGTVDEVFSDSLILDVSGVGYLVYASSGTLSKLPEGSKTSLFIETHVREELINLYGFLTKSEKDCFLKLNLVSGVGTRVALSIMSGLSVSDIANAIARQDKSAFKSISGIGIKLAERIILELKDKFIAGSIEISKESGNNAERISDAISALTNLGISRNDAYTSIQRILKEKPEIELDALIRESLKIRNG